MTESRLRRNGAKSVNAQYVNRENRQFVRISSVA